MNDIVVINKEKGMTSHDVVNRIRKIFNTKRVGHLGTLDPLATGVLVVCIDEATKLVQFLQDHEKSYIARVCLGKSTDTYDLEGQELEKCSVDNIDIEKLDQIINGFLYETKQLPPMYSSIKVNGKKLYEYAREGKTVELVPREIKIHEIKRISELEYIDGCCYFDILVHVSKGTYIRSLCFDLGKKMGLPSLMADLKRISSDIFTLEDASTIDEIASGNYKSFTMLDALCKFVKTSNEEFVKKSKCGMKISLKDVKDVFNELPNQFVISENNDLVGIYQISDDNKFYRAVRVWN